MRRLAIGALALALLGAWNGPAPAQTQLDPIGDIYLSFSNTLPPNKGAAGRYLDVVPFAPFSFYIMFHVDFGQPPYNDPGRNQTDGATAWEASITIPASVTVTSRTLPAGHTDFGTGDNNWIVGTGGQCVLAANTPSVLVTHAALMLAAASDVRMDLGAASPPSFNPPQPGFLGCPPPPGQLYPTKPGNVQAHYIILNCVTNCPSTPGDEESWGSLKSTYSPE